ncbi:hypothetical protein ACNOYE_04105 [Nannocystaceae bacterium ST9]
MDTLDRADLERLLHDAPDGVLSLYLHVDPSDPANEHSVPHWRYELERWLASTRETLPEDRRAAFEAARVQAEPKLAAPIAGKTLVVFASADSVHATSLPFALPVVHEFGPPRVDPLLWAIDEYEHYLIVMVDRDRVRTISAWLGSPQAESAKLEPEGHWGAKQFSRTGHAQNAESHEQTWQHRWLRAVAGELQTQLTGKSELGRIILAGDEKQAKALRQELPTSLRRAVIGVVALPFELEDHHVIERISPLALAHERAVELELVRAVIDRAKQGDRGALGRQAVGEALDAHQVRRLLLASPAEDTALAADFVRRSFACAAKVEFVQGEAATLLRAQGQPGGVAAELYWS